MFVERFAHPEPTSDFPPMPRFFRELVADAGAVELGETILEAIDANAFEPGLGYPTDIREVVRVAGFDAYGPFNRGAKYVAVVENDDLTLTMIPTRNVARQGFMHTPDQAVVSTRDPLELGHAVREALARSTTRK